MEEVSKPSKFELGEMLLEIGVALMVSGANTQRIKMTISRIANAFDCDTDLLITNHALMLTLTQSNKVKAFTSVKYIPGMHLNFNLIADISSLSWKIVEEKWSLQRINTEFKNLNRKPLYPRILVLCIVALAGATLCRISGGDVLEMLVGFIGTLIGIWIRQESMKLQFNFYLCVYFAAVTASSIVGIYSYLYPANEHINAFATSVLFLIPGVPMINSLSDLIDGNILNGTLRGVNVLIISFSIALGLMTSILIFNL
jgi:uncharacterized membrane protein YjjP (DUF1212 family)